MEEEQNKFGGSNPVEGNRRARKDKNRLHATHHGILSRHPLQALILNGENIRELRRTKRLLHNELRPRGVLGEILFDRAWSSYLRCTLISRSEANIFAPENQSLDGGHRGPILREANLPTLVYSDAQLLNNFSGELLKHLAVVQRYDSHFSREFYRSVGMLLAMRDAGDPGLTEELAKVVGRNQIFPEETNE
jgi:hypothetical protein